MKNVDENADLEDRRTRRRVPALLIETTPSANGLFNWILASPMILFIGWLWIDLFVYFDPIPWYWLDAIVGAIIYLFLILLPLGYVAHQIVTALPRLFQNAGWDVQPLVDIRPEEQYTIQYTYTDKKRAETTPSRIWMRAGQGLVYLEIIAIFVGAMAIIPLFLSALEFGLGR